MKASRRPLPRQFFVWAILVPAAGVSFCHSARGDVFGSGVNSFTIQFVTIGHPNNPADFSGSPSPAGAVPYTYRIGKYEISEQMIEKANAVGGLGISKDARGPNKPATGVSWLEAARFVNWLNESAGSTPAYKFDAHGNFQLWAPGDVGYDAANLFRNSHAKYFLPSVDEWYKAAFYDPAANIYYDFPTGSNGTPLSVGSGTSTATAVYNRAESEGPADITQAGGLSPFGTMAQGGNVSEWEETAEDGSNGDPDESRGARGGAWAVLGSTLSSSGRGGRFPSVQGIALGLRVASVVPEPGGLCLSACCSLLHFAATRRKQHDQLIQMR